jgi:regulator of RNase E activity RraB
MSIKILSCFCFIACFPIVTLAQSNDMRGQCDQTANVQFDTNDIFNLDDPDSIFIHYWANFFHIKTKEITLLNESAFFLQKCGFEQADLAELERHLRKQKYIREAKVTKQDTGKIKVETWDNWSLMPTVDFGRKGGTNKYAIGIKDRNLLGLGIDAEIEYFSNNQRTGYKLDTQFPLFLKKNLSATIRLTSNDDGSSQAVFLQKDFVSFDTKNAYKIGFDNFTQIDSQFQNGTTVAQYHHDKSFSMAQWQWLVEDSATQTLRYGLGYIREKHKFTDLIGADLSPPPSNPDLASFVPQNRNYQYPFLSVEYLQKDYLKLTNFNLINQIEDFNLGWHISALVGKDFSNSEQSPEAIWQTSLSKGLQTSAHGYLFFDAQFVGEWQAENDGQDRLQLMFSTEYFHKFNDNWGAYFKNANTLSKNAFLDEPVALGDDSGVRGYPLQYQHGQRTTQFTVEARYYPHINIYKLFELGGAAFLDTGKAFGDSPVANVNTSVLTSVGLGLRFFSTHSSDRKVIHLDLVKPLSTDVNVNGVEIRVTTKQSF